VKGILILELFGEDARQMAKLYRGMFEVGGGDFGRAYFDKHIGVPPRSSWVAEITGPDEKYGLSRVFLKAKTDYSKSNSKGSRGILVEYILSQGKIYEVKEQITWKRSERYFCIINDDGDVIKIDEETACHSVGALTYKERREQQSAERISGDQRP